MASFDEAKLATLRASYAPKSLERKDLLADEYVLATHGPYRVYYAPIGAWPLPQTRIIFVGLTPGFAQLEAAARLFLSCPDFVRTDEMLYSQQLRAHVAFAGTMRRNLCRMLDDLGIPASFEIKQSEELFAERGDAMAATSALVLPVFKGPSLANFSGVRELGKIPLFQEMLTTLLLPRLRRAPDSLLVPFGVSAESGLNYLVRERYIDGARVLTGFPHPSGANGHRKKLFESNRERLKAELLYWVDERAQREVLNKEQARRLRHPMTDGARE